MLSSRRFLPVCAALLGAAVSHAQTVVEWKNVASDFATGSNWTTGAAPLSTQVAAFSSAVTVQPVLASAYTVGGLSFWSAAGNATLSGTGSLTITSSGLRNDSAGLVTVAVPLVFSGSASPITNNGSIALSGSITNNTTYALMFNGSGSAGLVSGAITSNAGVVVSSGVWTFTGANTYTGPTMIDFGNLTIGAVNALPNGGTLWMNSGSLNVAFDQTLRQLTTQNYGQVNIASGATLTIAPGANEFGGVHVGPLSGTGTLNIAGGSGSSFLVRNYNNTFSGVANVTGGTLLVEGYNPLGNATINVGAGANLAVPDHGYYSYGSVLQNPVTLASDAGLSGGRDRDDQMLTLNGIVTVPTTTASLRLGGVVEFASTLKAASGNSTLTLTSMPDSFGQAVITGTIDPSLTGVSLNSAGMIFANATSVPTAGTFGIQGTLGYVGIALQNDTGSIPTAASALALIDPVNFNGTFGFDTPDDDAAIPVSSEALNLSAFGNLTLGSTTQAILTGTITPSAAGYRFGNGGGALLIGSALTGDFPVSVDSVAGLPENHLIAVFQGANTYTGNLTVNNSVAILDSATALPALSTVSLGQYGYVGATEQFTGVTGLSDFIQNRLTSYTATSVLGFDSATYIALRVAGSTGGTRYVNERIDLTNLAPVYLGTATSVVLEGEIRAPTQGGANGTLSLMAANDGLLGVRSPLVNGYVNRVVVGSAGSPYATGAVALVGPSTYGGGTTLESGALLVNTSSVLDKSGGILSGPLGTGTLTVAAGARKPTLATEGYIAQIFNPVVLNASLRLGIPYYEGHLPTDAGVYASSEFPITYNTLMLHGLISGTGGLEIVQNAFLTSANTFSGGVNLLDGALYLGHDSALGTGNLYFGQSSAGTYYGLKLVSLGGDRTLGNNVVFNRTPSEYLSVFMGGEGRLTFNGAVQLDNTVELAVGSRGVQFNGPISGNGHFVGAGAGPIVFNGSSNSANGGFESASGALVFASESSMPVAPYYNVFTSDAGGYIGIGFLPTSLQTVFLDRFDKANTYGAIGFDTVGAGTHEFGGAIDLTGFAATARLGSTTRARLTGTITPQGTVFNFGSGGGFLEVASLLADLNANTARSLNVTSPSSSSLSMPLTLRLTGVNTYTGGTTVNHSGLIFGVGALPSVGTISNFHGYVGTEDVNTFQNSPDVFLSRVGTGMTDGILGFDSFSGSPFTVLGNISLGAFASATETIYLGTATSAVLSSPTIVTPASGSGSYAFAGFKGGQLVVNTVLSGAKEVVIGYGDDDANTLSAETGIMSAVTLNGANTYTGATRLRAGTLYLGNDSALGAGTLEVESTSSNDIWRPSLLTAGGAREIANNINLNAYELNIGGENALTLKGALSGPGALFKVGNSTLTLSGANGNFYGDYNLQEGSITFGTGSSIGTGMLNFNGSLAVSATFEDNSVLYGVRGYNGNETINLTAGKTLTINQPYEAEYMGVFAGSTAGLIFTGQPLRLSGASTFVGPSTVKYGGTVIVQNGAAFGASTNAVTVESGTLAVGPGVVLANPVTVTSGTLGGAGTFQIPAMTNGFSVGSGVVLSPALSGVGTLTFDGSLISTSTLLLGSGGVYLWSVRDVANTGGWDQINVNGTVSITATDVAPFIFSLESVGADGNGLVAMNFDPTQNYSWTILTANSITGFTSSSQFYVSSSDFMNFNTGVFSVGLTGNSLTLNFAAVPEPSTYVLMLVGAGLTLLVARRRLRASR